jgi:MFS-type transporter involved in bile tolerance (Atg22 family)
LIELSHLLMPEERHSTLHAIDSHSFNNLVLLALVARGVAVHEVFYNALLLNTPEFMNQFSKNHP